MGEKLKQVPTKVKTFFSKLGRGMKILLGVVVVLALAAIIGLVAMRMNKPYTVLFTELTSEDMTSVLNYLDGRGVTDYRVQNNDTILVPSKDEPSLRAGLLMENYPTSGFNYARYENGVDALSSEEDRKRLYLFDLQDRLGATVRCLEGVKDAKVTIAEGKDHRYILDTSDTVEATASVTVTMKGNQALTSQKATAIRRLIGASVQGLNFTNIEIVDSLGNTFSGDDEVGSATEASALKLSLQNRVNEAVRRQVLEVLVPMYGERNVSVAVNSTVDVSRTYTDSVEFDLPPWADDGSTGGAGIIGRRIYDNRVVQGDDEAAGGIAGTATNADLNEYVESYRPDGSEQELGSAGEIDYNNNHTQTQRETPAGVITDIMVSVSVNSNAVTVPNVNNVVAHVARAAGIDSAVQNQKVSVLLSPFYEEPPETEPGPTGWAALPHWAVYALIAGIILFLFLLLLILLLVRRRKKKKQAEEAAAAEAARLAEELAAQQAAEALAAGEESGQEEGADIMEIHTERSMELRKTVREFAENNPEVAAQMLRNWLKEGEENS